jgi:hypothetical protein
MSPNKIIVPAALALVLSSSVLLFGADADVRKCVCQPLALLIVKINGKVVNWAIMAEIKPGKIAFQSEGGAIEFRNALLTVLP